MSNIYFKSLGKKFNIDEKNSRKERIETKWICEQNKKLNKNNF